MNAPADSFEEEAVNPILTVCLVSGLSLAAPQTKPVLTVVVHDLAGIDPAVRNIAKVQAIRVLNKAGVELQWIDANSVEDPRLLSTMKRYGTVVITRQALNGLRNTDAMGFASVRSGPDPRAYVFYGMVNAFAENFSRSKSDLGIILGHAIVHELGHLVIPGNAHGAGAGIMSPDWGHLEWVAALQGALLFVPDHARMLREGLQTNCGHFVEGIPCVLESRKSEPEY